VVGWALFQCGWPSGGLLDAQVFEVFAHALVQAGARHGIRTDGHADVTVSDVEAEQFEQTLSFWSDSDGERSLRVFTIIFSHANSLTYVET
jgi:hypothetical protein